MKVRIKAGVNESLLREVRERVKGYLKSIVGDFVEVDGVLSFNYGSITVNVEVIPWHEEDVLVNVFSYLTDNVSLTDGLARTLLELNARFPLGAFALGAEDSVLYRYALAGANLDLNELAAAVYTVATVADSYDEFVREYSEASRKRVD